MSHSLRTAVPVPALIAHALHMSHDGQLLRDQVGCVCAAGARLQGGEGLQGVAAGGDRAQPGGRSLCLDCPVPA